jgi:hypothetical protein
VHAALGIFVGLFLSGAATADTITPVEFANLGTPQFELALASSTCNFASISEVCYSLKQNAGGFNVVQGTYNNGVINMSNVQNLGNIKYGLLTLTFAQSFPLDNPTAGPVVTPVWNNPQPISSANGTFSNVFRPDNRTFQYTFFIEPQPASELIDLNGLRFANNLGGIWGFDQLSQELVSVDVATTCLPIPEPESFAMLLTGLCLMGGVARRRKGQRVAVHEIANYQSPNTRQK